MRKSMLRGTSMSKGDHFFIMKSGECYDVFRPDVVMVMRRMLAIGYPADDYLPDGVHFVPIRNVTALLTIPTRRQVSCKGAQAQRATRADAENDAMLDLLS